MINHLRISRICVSIVAVAVFVIAASCGGEGAPEREIEQFPETSTQEATLVPTAPPKLTDTPMPAPTASPTKEEYTAVASPSPETGKVSLELQSHVGGAIRAVSVQGQYAYVSEGVGITILDISDPTVNPFNLAVVGRSKAFENVPVGRDTQPAYIVGLDVGGDYIYATAGVGGLRILDASDPSDPRETGKVSGEGRSFNDVAVRDRYVYVAADGQLIIFDIADPSSPVMAGSVPSGGTHIEVSGGYAYLVDSGGYLTIIDVSIPEEPGILSRRQHYVGRDIFVKGNHLYNLGDRLALDITNPSQPRQLGDHVVSGQDIVVVGDIAYVSDRDSLRVFDVSEPSSPQLLGNTGELLRRGYEVAIAGTYAYIADRAELMVIDISNLSDLRKVGSYATPGFPVDVEVRDGRAYVADAYLGMHIIEGGDSQLPRTVFSYPILTLSNNQGVPCGISLNDDYVYLASSAIPPPDTSERVRGGVMIMDITDPQQPSLAGHYVPPVLFGTPRRQMCPDYLDVEGDYAYIFTDPGGFRVVDISNPEDPVERGSHGSSSADPSVFAFEGSGGDQVFAVQGYVYVAAEGGRFQIYRVTNPDAPVALGEFRPSTRAPFVRLGTVFVSDDYAYSVGAGTFIVDVSDRNEPTLVGSHELGFSDVHVSGEYVYTTAGSDLVVLDVSDPTSPQEITSRSLPGYSVEAVYEEFPYVYAVGDGGLFVLRLQGLGD